MLAIVPTTRHTSPRTRAFIRMLDNLIEQSQEQEAAYRAALAFMDALEPTPERGLAFNLRAKDGRLLKTLNEIVLAIQAGELE